MKPIRLGLVGLHNHYHAIPFADELLIKGIDGLELVAVSDERADLVKEFGDHKSLATAGRRWSSPTGRRARRN